MDFRIYYEGDTYDGSPEWAPFFGVLLILERDKEHGRRVVSQGDYYVFDLGRWWPKDWIGLIDYLAQPGMKKVICGRMVPNPVWEATYRRAEADKDFPVRTGYGVNEHV